MSTKNWYRDGASPDNNLVCIEGTITITGSNGATTADTLTHASGSRTGTGTYRIHLDDSFVSLKSAQLTLEKSDTQLLIPQVTAHDVGAGKYVDFSLLTASSGAPAQPTAASVKVHVALTFKDSSFS